MGLLDQINEVLNVTPRKYWGEKANRLGSLLTDAASTGAQAYSSASGPLAPQHAQTLGGLLMDFSPLGDVKSAYDGVQSAREGDYLGAALGGLGALPLVPNLGGVLRNADLQSKAMKHFGTTYSPKETGFLLDNGKRLDLSGRHYGSGYQKQGDKFVPNPGEPDYLRGARAVDHRELGDLVEGSQWEGLSKFLNETGAVRYMPNTGISAVDTNMPSREQIEMAVKDFRSSGNPLYVDVDTLRGSSRASQEFERPTVDAVMEWIKSQMKPEAFK